MPEDADQLAVRETGTLTKKDQWLWRIPEATQVDKTVAKSPQAQGYAVRKTDHKKA